MADRAGPAPLGEPFDPAGYRKRVLAAVERRGGPTTSDVFELYDLPLSDPMTGAAADRAVAVRIDEVWASWQRLREDPKYRTLSAQLVAEHEQRSAAVRTAEGRADAGDRARAQRARRDAQRHELLDAAIERLRERHGTVPDDKVAGLHDLGATSGLSRVEVDARLAGATSTTGPDRDVERVGRIRDLLVELGRLSGETEAPATLLVLLELGPDATAPQVRARAGALRSRARELGATRLRAVLDELLVHVAELLEPGPDAVRAYLDAVAADVTRLLRPKVAAAVLVEDRLIATDHTHLLALAQRLGLDRTRAVAVLAGLAAEHGATVEGGPTTSPQRHRSDDHRPDAAGPRADAARTAGAGQPSGPRPDSAAAGRPPQSPAGPTVDRRRAPDLAAPTGVTARRVPGAVLIIWSPVPAAPGVVYRVRRRRPDGTWQVCGRTGEVELADGGAPDGPLSAYGVAAVLDGHTGPETVVEPGTVAPSATSTASALPIASTGLPGPATDAGPTGPATSAGSVGPAAPGAVQVRRLADGTVQVSWTAGGDGPVEYRVRAATPSGGWRVVGRTRATTLDDGGAADSPLGAYTVSARPDGADRSAETRWEPP